MKKIAVLAGLFLCSCAFSFGQQVTWSSSDFVTASMSYSGSAQFSQTSFQVVDGNISNTSASTTDFGGGGSGVYLEANFGNGESPSFRLYINDQSGSAPATLSGLTFSFTVPQTITAEVVSGYTGLVDNSNVLDHFTLAFDGLGGFTLTETSDFNLLPSTAVNLIFDFTSSPAAVPEPSTTALFAAVAAAGLVVYRRRQQRKVA